LADYIYIYIHTHTHTHIYIYMWICCSHLCVVRTGTVFVFLSCCTAQKATVNMNYCENLIVMACLWFTSCQIINQFLFLHGLSIKILVHGKHVPIYISVPSNPRLFAAPYLAPIFSGFGNLYIYDFTLDIYTLYISPKVTDLFLELLCHHWHKLCIVFIPNVHWLAPCNRIKWWESHDELIVVLWVVGPCIAPMTQA
jgi:hypothetical protein